MIKLLRTTAQTSAGPVLMWPPGIHVGTCTCRWYEILPNRISVHTLTILGYSWVDISVSIITYLYSPTLHCDIHVCSADIPILKIALYRLIKTVISWYLTKHWYQLSLQYPFWQVSCLSFENLIRHQYYLLYILGIGPALT